MVEVEDAFVSENSALIGRLKETRKPDQENGASNNPSRTHFSARQKVIFLLIVYGHMAVFICVALPSAFMAEYIVKRGGTKEDAALVLNVTLLSMAISSALFGKYQANIGTKRLFLGGVLLYALGQAIFGVLEYAPNALTMVSVGITIRIIQGVGQGGYLVAALTTMCQEFPDNAATAFSIAETFASVGYTCGPLLGSVLFSVFKSIFPTFLISNVLLIPLFLAGMYLVKNYDNTRAGETLGIDFIKKPAVVFLLIVVTSIYGHISSLGTVLGSLYLIKLGFSIVKVGLSLVLLSLVYSVFSILVGFITAKSKRIRRVIWSIGILGLGGIVFAFTPTLPEFGVYVSFSALGVAYAFALISSFGELLYLAICDNLDSKADFAVHSAVSGAWNMALGIGEFVYPLIGASYPSFMGLDFVLFSDFALGIVLALVAAGVAALLRYLRK